MKMNFGPRLEIQDLRNHPASVVIGFAILLAGTVMVKPDPKRKGFYEVEDGRTLYYFCVREDSKTIFLLAFSRKAFPPPSDLEVALAAHS